MFTVPQFHSTPSRVKVGFSTFEFFPPRYTDETQKITAYNCNVCAILSWCGTQSTVGNAEGWEVGQEHQDLAVNTPLGLL